MATDTTHEHGNSTTERTARTGAAARRAVGAVAAVVFAATLVTLNAGRGRVTLSLGDLILSAAAAGVLALLVGVGLTARHELTRR